MDQISIEIRCRKKAEELLEKYFPNFIREASATRPEKLAMEYNDELPRKVGKEFRDWLSILWKEVCPHSEKQFDDIMNLHLSMKMVEASYVPYLDEARKDAEKITLWEKITKTNHEDVTYYKGLLKQYTEEILDTMIKDFVGDL